MGNKDDDMWPGILRWCKHLPINEYPILGQLAARNVVVTSPIPRGAPVKNRCWLVGPYKVITSVGAALRSDVKLQSEFKFAGILLGERENDDPPSAPWQRKIGFRGATLPTPDYTHKRPNPSRPTARPIESARQTDRFAADQAFWAARTPEAHHIVEDNIVRAIRQDWGVLMHDSAPCVLLFAELHQRWINRVANQHRSKFTANMTRDTASSGLDAYIRDLYSSPTFRPIGSVAEVIRDVIVGRF